MPLGNMDNMTDEQTKAIGAGFLKWQADHNPTKTPTATANPVNTPTVANPTTNVAYPRVGPPAPTTPVSSPVPTQKLIGPILGPESSRPMVPVNQPPVINHTPTIGAGVGTTTTPFGGTPPASNTGPFTSMFPSYGPPAPTTTPQVPQSDGTLHLSVNGQAQTDVPVFKGTSFESGADLAKQLGLDYKADPKTGEITIGGTKVMPTGYDKQGNAIVGVRAVANALGYQIGYDDKNKQITITGKPPGPDLSQQANVLPWQAPDLSQFQNGFMPYQSFNGNMDNYYTQAHSQLDAQYNQQKQALLDKQNTDIKASDESMNRRGIYSSGVAQSVEDDLRTKTTAAVANVLSNQMAAVAKTAQSLYNDAYSQYLKGNEFALKNNQDIIKNMLDAEKQSFNEYIGTQKLSNDQLKIANDAFNKAAILVQKQAQAQLPYQYQTVNNMADNQSKMDIALLPYQHMTVYQQMTTQEKAAMDGAMIVAKQQGLQLDAQKLAESITHNRNTETNTANAQSNTAAHNAATEAETNRHNTATEANSSNKPKAVDSKESFNQSASIKSQLDDKRVNDSKNIDKSKAKAFIDANKDILTDSDYRDLQAWADSTFKK